MCQHIQKSKNHPVTQYKPAKQFDVMNILTGEKFPCLKEIKQPEQDKSPHKKQARTEKGQDKHDHRYLEW